MRVSWPGRLVFGSIVNAAADGKRLLAIDALSTKNNRSVRPKPA